MWAANPGHSGGRAENARTDAPARPPASQFQFNQAMLSRFPLGGRAACSGRGNAAPTAPGRAYSHREHAASERAVTLRSVGCRRTGGTAGALPSNSHQRAYFVARPRAVKGAGYLQTRNGPASFFYSAAAQSRALRSGRRSNATQSVGQAYFDQMRLQPNGSNVVRNPWSIAQNGWVFSQRA